MSCAAIAFAAFCGSAPALAQVRHFDVPSEDAGKSIPEFARQARIQIIAPGDQLHGVITPPIKGSYDVFVALELMLKGTGLKVGRSAEGVVAISLPGACPRTQFEIQFLRRDESRGNLGGAIAACRMGSCDARVRSCRVRPRPVVERFRRPVGRYLRSFPQEAERRDFAILASRTKGAQHSRPGRRCRPESCPEQLFKARPTIPPRPERRRQEPRSTPRRGYRGLSDPPKIPGIRLKLEAFEKLKRLPAEG